MFEFSSEVRTLFFLHIYQNWHVSKKAGQCSATAASCLMDHQDLLSVGCFAVLHSMAQCGTLVCSGSPDAGVLDGWGAPSCADKGLVQFQ